MFQILGHFLPMKLRGRLNRKGPDYEEIVIAERMGEFNFALSGIDRLLKPTHEMANFISLELARVNKIPA